MNLPIDVARRALRSLESGALRNLIAQAQAKYVLLETKEDPVNFPRFDPALDEKITFIAYMMLDAGRSLATQGFRRDSIQPLQRAASILQYVHGPVDPPSKSRSFHRLVAAMAFYAAGQYSRAFVTIRNVETETPAGGAISSFLKKDFSRLIRQIGAILLPTAPRSEQTNETDDDAEGVIITIMIARSLSLTIEFIYSGQADALRSAMAWLGHAAEVAVGGNHTGWWWITQLLMLIISDLQESSPWTFLVPLFPPESRDQVNQYIRLLAFGRVPGAELWISQRAAIPIAIQSEHPGAVINLRTSGGKTRVAEIAILEALLKHEGSKVLYLAPFRSLAFELEHTLSETFSSLGFQVSHLYGNSRVSSADTTLAADASIIIATPEKARALLRSAPEVLATVKLFVIDEGHLLGAQERHIRNEVFFDHLRITARAAQARVLLLSAVVPNAEQLASWITGDPANLATSSWKPSEERFGLLRWDGKHVKLEWRGDVPSFNPSFVTSKPLGFSRRRKPFPSDKAEAIAATAVRLSAIGPVMIFTGKALSVPNLARAVLTAMGEYPPDHDWPKREWRSFCTTCEEYVEPDAIELEAARVGIICHSARLPNEVRLSVEHLMRARPPKVIIATTTLGQGVNVGISTVIIASPYVDENPVSVRDFWNICGRAGRAFVDGEGKVLYAIDDTESAWKIKKNEGQARKYFDGVGADPVESGLLHCINVLVQIAARAGVDFKLLLDLAAENDFSSLGEYKDSAEGICDLIDDELLALHLDGHANPGEQDPSVWIDAVFRNSLAAIQARAGSYPGTVSDNDALRLLATRAGATLRTVPSVASRHAIVSSGLPFRAAVRAQLDSISLSAIADAYLATGAGVDSLVAATKAVEQWARASAAGVTGPMPDATVLDLLRPSWLRGEPLNKMLAVERHAARICSEVYGYQMPWIMHAISQQLRSDGDALRADVFAKLALLVELGVSDELSAAIFLCGIRSRVASMELSGILHDTLRGETAVLRVARFLRDRDVVAHLKPMVSDLTASWLDILAASGRSRSPAPRFPDFSVTGIATSRFLHVRKFKDRFFLCSSDYRERVAVGVTEEFRFDLVADDPRIVFERENGVWRLKIRDPRLQPDATA